MKSPHERLGPTTEAETWLVRQGVDLEEFRRELREDAPRPDGCVSCHRKTPEPEDPKVERWILAYYFPLSEEAVRWRISHLARATGIVALFCPGCERRLKKGERDAVIRKAVDEHIASGRDVIDGH